MNSTTQNTLFISSLHEISAAAEEFLERTKQHNVIAFNGQMAAGKTTFIKALCAALGVAEETTSPTFSLVNEYQTSAGSTIYHFDLYRIEHTEELLDMGFEDYVYSGHKCFIEWAEIAAVLLPPDTLWVTLRVNENGVRIVEF
ncbi:MAG: tRNA (adenosine(37)-N6)-threonylcarbamoyltransferase complex ATPase subunit type 1 TsaE [Bacteroidales bacterium]|jgi:tRNA threonylcarbamoyladenosine biosynthesis protein TsaE|nr:tRNA (adenosine(37)-N6)-threonylcarbamoyltransferase complex ATPase subunit type 1 TsaE [Bacteroidales bacterium]